VERPNLTVSIGSATELWILWAWITLEHLDEARAARERDSGPPVNNAELQASMISIVAAASAIDGFATVVREAGVPPSLPADAEAGRGVVVWETLRANFQVRAHTQTWPAALKELWKLRSHGVDGGLVHPRTVPAEPAPFPPEVPAPARTTYTVESAKHATALMIEIITECNLGAVRPGLDDLHRRVEGFTIAGYVDDFARKQIDP
jgi:hypothetical protein